MTTDNSVTDTSGEYEDETVGGEGAETTPSGPTEVAEEGGATYDLAALSRDELEDQVELARAEIERLQDQSLRRQAELVNFRRRAQRDLAQSTAVGQGRLLELLVPVIDDFERAAATESEDVGAYKEGMQLILRSLQRVLEQMGVERIEPLGEVFDPEFHEAIARHETDEAPEGQIIDVFQAGYKLGDRLVRPATVVVAYAGAGAAADAQADDSGGAAATEDGDVNDV